MVNIIKERLYLISGTKGLGSVWFMKFLSYIQGSLAGKMDFENGKAFETLSIQCTHGLSGMKKG